MVAMNVLLNYESLFYKVEVGLICMGLSIL
jgi:hypothetical protein